MTSLYCNVCALMSVNVPTPPYRLVEGGVRLRGRLESWSGIRLKTEDIYVNISVT